MLASIENRPHDAAELISVVLVLVHVHVIVRTAHVPLNLQFSADLASQRSEQIEDLLLATLDAASIDIKPAVGTECDLDRRFAH